MKYGVIYADPPWAYNNRSANRITKFGGGAMAHYPVMKDSELEAMRPLLDQLADDNCLLAMWVTGPRMAFGVELVKLWGFRFVTVGFVWGKTNKKSGTPVTCPGFYTSSSCEYVLFGVRGSVRPEKAMVPQFLNDRRGQHSQKPHTVRKRLEEMYPNVHRIELFARTAAPGWSVWGNETEKFRFTEEITEEINHPNQLFLWDESSK